MQQDTLGDLEPPANGAELLLNGGISSRRMHTTASTAPSGAEQTEIKHR